MKEERIPYELKNGSTTRLALEEYLAEQQSVWQQWKAFARKYKARTSKIYGNPGIKGLFFKNASPPKGWIVAYRDGREVAHKPHSRNARKDYELMSKIPPLPSTWGLGDRLGTGSPMVNRGSQTYIVHPDYEKVGERLFLLLVKEHKVPPDAKSVKRSTYWRIREKAAA